MENKRAIAITIILIALAIIVVAGYKLGTSYMWNEDETITDAKEQLIQHLKDEEDPTKKLEQVKLYLEANKITQAEADEILNN